MSLVVNHNLAASRTATLLNASYTQLSASTQRLSSRLRINSAADNAASATRTRRERDIKTLDRARQMLLREDEGLVKNDMTRAHFGSLQNRMENTVINLTAQAEHLQASELGIFDVDMATEMTEYTRSTFGLIPSWRKRILFRKGAIGLKLLG